MAGEIQFEKALEKLEEIVSDLESGDIALEQALKKYEEGIKLARNCQKKLSEAEKKIEILTKKGNGYEAEDFDPDAEVRKEKKSSKTKKSSNDEDLLI